MVDYNSIMNCLYLAEDYIGSKVHHQLCQALSKEKDIALTVFAVQRKDRVSRDLTNLFLDKKYSLRIAPLVSSHLIYKYFFSHKIAIKKKLLLSCIDIQSFNLIHAATLFSEGALAYQLYLEYNIPYIVAVRGSDINFYFKKMPHLWKMGKTILQNAQKIIFISPSSQQKFFEINHIKSLVSKIENKITIIPNGIDDYWHNQRYAPSVQLPPKNILYVGRFDNNKNVLALISAIQKVREQFPEVQLHLVGGRGEQASKIIAKIAQNDWLSYFGEIYEREELKKIYRQHDLFAMVSHSETFGLVYLEALSQGLPVIYSNRQGIDGLFKNGIVGYSASSIRTEEIANAIIKAIRNYKTLRQNIDKLTLDDYSWGKIASHYQEIYQHFS